MKHIILITISFVICFWTFACTAQIENPRARLPENTPEYQLSRVKRLHEVILKKIEDRLIEINVLSKDKEVRKDKKKYLYLKREKTHLEKFSRAMRKGQAPYIGSLDVNKLKPEQIGCFKRGIVEKFKVLEVLGPDQLIIYPIISRMTISVSGKGASQSFYNESGNNILLTKHPTDGLTRGSDLYLVDFYIVKKANESQDRSMPILEAYSIKALYRYLTSLKKNNK